MSGSQFSVDHTSLHTAAKNVRDVRTEVDGELKTLAGVVDDLSVAWRGQAGAGFQQLMLRWNGDVSRLLTALDEIANLLDKSGTTHQVNDEEQNQMFNRFDGALNA